jgi:anti-sigma factor RsiW
MTRDERLVAYADGELSGDQLAQFEAELAADPGLAQAVERHRALQRRLSAAYAPVLDEPVPSRLTSAVRPQPAARRGPPPWAAMAACLVAGVAAGVALSRYAGPQAGPLVARDRGLVATGSLETALTSQLASQTGPIKLGLTFRTAAGRYCRTFQSPADRLAGRACREPGGWTLQATARMASAQIQGEYRTAGSDTPGPVLAAVDGLIAGAPLDAAAERAARDAGWK